MTAADENLSPICTKIFDVYAVLQPCAQIVHAAPDRGASLLELLVAAQAGSLYNGAHRLPQSCRSRLSGKRSLWPQPQIQNTRQSSARVAPEHTPGLSALLMHCIARLVNACLRYTFQAAPPSLIRTSCCIPLHGVEAEGKAGRTLLELGMRAMLAPLISSPWPAARARPACTVFASLIYASCVCGEAGSRESVHHGDERTDEPWVSASCAVTLTICVETADTLIAKARSPKLQKTRKRCNIATITQAERRLIWRLSARPASSP